MIYALIVIIAIVVALQLLLRTNTAVVFFAVCAGSVLVAAAGKDTDLLAHSLGGKLQVSTNVAQAAVMLFPAIISAILLRKRIKKPLLIMAVVPALCSALVGLTIVYPFLSGSFQNTLTASTGWPLIAQYYELIVVVGIVSSLLVLALTIPKHHKDDHHKKGKH
ncbi:MAG: hypothetical protein JWO47_355 [Candidatus Saccharibacteria bacterium]|nr:hypothetical protein [Candidatus Saccharibacteria bacterium]